MKSIFFLDDWMLDSRENVVRKFNQPERINQEMVFDEPHPLAKPGKGYQNIIRDPKSGLYRMWYEVAGSRPLPGGNFTGTLCYAESKDGLTWTYPDLGFAKKMGLDSSFRNAVGYDIPPIGTAKVAYDPSDPDNFRRYKLPAQTEGQGIPAFPIYVSVDGIEWKLVKNSSWFPDEPSRMGTDCDNNLMYNPVTKRWQIICRNSCLDRRVALTESDDLVRWTPPRVILYPDSLDEPLMQFYSMSQFIYHDTFIGLMQVQHIASTERAGACKWLGKMDNELMYGYNGVHWNRTTRRPFILRLPLGQPGCEEIYTNSMVETEDGSLRFYTYGDIGEHGYLPAGIESKSSLLVHTLRPCGFACLEPVAGYGFFATRFLIPRSNDLRINFLAPNGRVWIQVTNSEHKPFPGFTFEECVPMSGDQAGAKPQWTSGKAIDQFVNEGVKLEFKLFQAQVYAIHWNCHIQYGDPIIERI